MHTEKGFVGVDKGGGSFDRYSVWGQINSIDSGERLPGGLWVGGNYLLFHFHKDFTMNKSNL